jgi:hypothetical protein
MLSVSFLYGLMIEFQHGPHRFTALMITATSFYLSSFTPIGEQLFSFISRDFTPFIFALSFTPYQRCHTALPSRTDILR